MTVLSSSYSISYSYSILAQNAQDILIYVKNVTGQQIDTGKVVRISGATGDNALISLADWTNDANSANTLGLTNENIPDQAFGYVMTEGKLLGIDTSDYLAGQLLFLGASGSMTGSAPLAPLHGVRLGQVLRVQQNNGSMYVRIDNGYEIEELHDVRITNPINGQVLVRSGSIWVNEYPSTSSFSLTASFTPNAVVTASVSLNTITFTKGDGSTFPITVNTGSGGGTGVGFPFSGSAVITGSLTVTGSIVATQGISGSLFGTASWAHTASVAISILDQGYVHTQSTPSVTWNIPHNLNTLTPLVDVYTSDYYQVIPQEVYSTGLNNAVVVFPTAISGFAILSKGSGTAVSSSYALSASFAANTPFYKVGVSGSTSYTVTHNLNEEYPIVQIYDAVDKEQVIPASIQSVNTNQVFINIGFTFSGSIVVKK
jgi:hypothetical protein